MDLTIAQSNETPGFVNGTVVATAPALPSVGEALLHFLKMEANNDGVVYLFGVPGGGIMHLLDLIKDRRDEFKYIVCRHETGAAYMADGYYRATGKPGVVLVTTGPGATNALTGIMNANNDGSPMILISGEVSQEFLGMGYLQEGEDAKISINAIFSAATKYSAIVSSELSAVSIFKQAFRDIFVLPSQAVHLSLPDNITSVPLKVNNLPASKERYRTKQHFVNKNDVMEVLEVLSNAKRPLIFLGNGCRGAMNYHAGDEMPDRDENHEGENHLYEFMKFVEAWAIPVMTTPDGKGVFPERHELSLRVFGVANCIWPYYYMHAGKDEAPYDAIVVIGSSLGDLATSKWYPDLMPSNGMFYQVDISPEVIGRSYPLKKGIVAEAGAFVQCMHKEMHHFSPDKTMINERREILKQLKKDNSPFFSEEQYYNNSKPFQPAALMRVLDENLPKKMETHIYIDAGNCVGWANHYLAVELEWNIYSALSMGPMGFAVGAVVGSKIGRPNATAICITGDGAFMMQGSEVSTAAQYKVGAIWIVLNDNNLSMVSQGMAQFFPDHADPGVWNELYEVGSPDLVKYSEGLGADAYAVDEPDELKKLIPFILEKANQANKPQVVIVNIDPKPVPPYYNPLYATPKK